MKAPVTQGQSEAVTLPSDKPPRSTKLEALKRVARVLGILIALPFFIWAPLGLIPAIPSIIDVFGIDGLRVPTGIVIAGLIIAAFGFEDF